MQLALIGAILLLAVSCQSNSQCTFTHVEIDGSVGKLTATLQIPQLHRNAEVSMVILMHGITSNKETELMTLLANDLCANGVASIRFDFNGHGHSEGTFREMTVPKELMDAQLVYAYVKSLPYVNHVSLLGHSQGGVVASMLAGELGDSAITSLVLMAPAAVLKDDALNGRTLGANYDPIHVPDYVTLFNGLQLGREYIETAQVLPIYETAIRYHGPVAIIHGLNDDVVDAGYAQRYQANYLNSELHLIDGENHGFTYQMQASVDLAVAFLIKTLR